MCAGLAFLRTVLMPFLDISTSLQSCGHSGMTATDLSLIHRFIAGKDRYSGPPHFVGPGDEFVACATLGGSTQIWKRDGNELVCSIPSHDRDPWCGGSSYELESSGGDVCLGRDRSEFMGPKQPNVKLGISFGIKHYYIIYS
ncbi:hypothetical protein C8J57DRAFT_705698 [Mycena rebaudengoi]|nr:hypothetical protein C8J57DRAFT_705698 [Mycena rebaudengoi]